MSRWLELKKKIESIPEKERRKNLVGKLAHYNQKTTQAYDSLVWSVRTQQCVRSIFPNGGFQRSVEQTRKASNVARTLQKKLVKQIEAIKEDALDKQFLAIDEFAKAAQRNLKEQWNDLLARKIADFEKLVNAASGANLAGSKSLTGILNRLRAQIVNPPHHDDAAKRIATDLETLENSVGTLGLKGRAGEFLMAAAAGQGNPKDLGDPEIVAFIERYNLWSLLKVKLG